MKADCPAAEKQHRRRPLRTEKIQGSARRILQHRPGQAGAWPQPLCTTTWATPTTAWSNIPQALESYKHSLLLDPDDVEAKKNFELTLKKIQEQKQQPQQQEQQDDQAEAEKQQKQKYEAMMQFLNQNEKQQMEKKKRKISAAKNEKDW